MTRRTVASAALAVLLALIGWAALAIEFDVSVFASLAQQRGLGEALFRFFRFFTIQTNIGVAILMTITAFRTTHLRDLPPSRVYAAALVYLAVTWGTYEVMLRRDADPHGMRLVTDVTMHDVVPALMLVYWLLFAPKSCARWSDALFMPVYPLLYFVATLVAGAHGEGYPYSFIDVARHGYPSVLLTAGLFLVIFLGLGLAVTALARWLDQGHAGARRS